MPPRALGKVTPCFGETENQFSLTRAALSKGLRLKSNFLSILSVKRCLGRFLFAKQGGVPNFAVKIAMICVLLPGVLSSAESPARLVTPEAETMRVVPVSDALVMQATTGNDRLGRLLEAAKPTIGVRYKWGGTRMDSGIDCSNYIWQLYRAAGTSYNRFLSTLALSRLRRSNGLHKVTFEQALPGDLLVYGYRDSTGKWRGHVVILIDKDGNATGHKGLVLGAHGGSIGQVQYITFSGFDAAYFASPKLRLANVLRVD
jgi:hypothetical protein